MQDMKNIITFQIHSIYHWIENGNWEYLDTHLHFNIFEILIFEEKTFAFDLVLENVKDLNPVPKWPI